jgi:hypothetical protein
MKRIAVLIVLIFAFVANLRAGDYKRYAKKSGIVKYELSGNSEGTSIVYWDDWGQKEFKIENTETTVLGFTTKEKKRTLILGEFIYTWNDKEDVVYKAESPIANHLNNSNMTTKEANDKSLRSIGYKEIGTETVNGKKCTVYEGLGGKLWAWEKYQIPVKVDVNILGINIVSTAVKFDLDAKIDQNIFALPEGKQIVENNRTQQNNKNKVTEKKPAKSKEDEIEKEAKKAIKNIFKSLF